MRLQSTIQGDEEREISDFLSDARRFILRNRQIADTAPLQLYSSGLMFAPKESITRTTFQEELLNWCQLPKVQETWSAELQTLESHSRWVQSVAFSPNGQLLASGSGDETIKLWDPMTGDLHHTLECHSGFVHSVAFSPNGQLLASGSNDQTIKLWDPMTGDLRHTLKGHFHWVWSVAFSPNGQLLASGSSDETIKLWDPMTGNLHHTLEGHSGLDWSVAFSPNGQLLASGSDDQTIKLWDPITGNLRHTLEGHFNWVWLDNNAGLSILNMQWICIESKKFLWLPPDYRPTSIASRNGILAQGHASGRVSFISLINSSE
ncbi:hypothetical protein ETB97_011894 [Aspergillus alliaceus]|uniref:Mitochondrial division protein 1 n=1 Tax=Petromyces alliaceus TaxID=209559 RepID=A0A8H6E0G1_PETAA|nr:hypothetical protein ETB97_011894 [Aspergillus burnettii]